MSAPLLRNSWIDSAWAIRCVWMRYLDVFRKGVVYGLITTFVEPLLYLFAFGFGLGSMVGDLSSQGETISYRRFIFSGIVGQTVLFQGFFEAAYGGFVRMYYQKIFHAMATTPITLSEVLWGELLWDASKSTFSAAAILLIGCVTGDFSLGGALLTLPLCFVYSLLFAGLGLWVAASSKTIDQISYPQYLFVFPMFLFCGVFFPIENLPSIVQALVWLFPLTPVVSLLRTTLVDLPLQWQTIPATLFWVLALVTFSRHAMMRRLVK